MLDFEEFKSEALNRCKSEEETKRVLEEIELFASRGWEKYILMVVNTVRDVVEQISFINRDYDLIGSAMDSYAVRLLTSDKRKSKDFLNDEKKRGILFNDALRFTIRYWDKTAMSDPEFENRLYGIVKSNIRELGLLYSEHFVTGINPRAIGSPNTKDNQIIVSKDPVPEDDERWILTETRKVREGEIEILRKYLILKVSMYSGM